MIHVGRVVLVVGRHCGGIGKGEDEKKGVSVLKRRPSGEGDELRGCVVVAVVVVVIVCT